MASIGSRSRDSWWRGTIRAPCEHTGPTWLSVRAWSVGLAVQLAVLSYALGHGHLAQAQQAEIPKLGKIQGMTCSRYPNASMYLGIPYATAERWKPPVLWDQPFQAPYLPATDFPPACPQSAKSQYPLSEDCLYLNIFAPTTDAIGMPVRVYIHGGWFNKGSASSGAALNDDYLKDACRMVSQTNTIFVSIQYRLGVFGFLSQPETFKESKTTGNWGIMDQQMALQWVNQNIQHFGGSAANVTLEGTNAGAVSIAIHMVSPGAQNLFTSALPHNAFSLILDPAQKAFGYTNALAVGVQCTSTDPKEQLACLRKADWKTLVDASPMEKPIIEPLNKVFFPVVDGNIIPQQPMDLITQGKTNGVPYTTTLNKHEGRTFVLGSYKNPSATVTADYISGFVRGAYPDPDQSQEILQAYPASSYATTVEQFADIWQDMFITCPTTNVMRALAKGQVYVRLVSFRQPPTCPIAVSVEGPGNEHELSYILNLDYVINTFCALSPAERVLAYNVMWSFAQTMTTGAPQLANGTQFAVWTPYKETATGIGQLPQTIYQLEMPLLKKCKMFDPRPNKAPQPTPLPESPPPPVVETPPPSLGTINCYVAPGAKKGAEKVSQEMSVAGFSSPGLAQALENAPKQTIICYGQSGPTNNQTLSKLGKKKIAGLSLLILHSLVAGAIALMTMHL